MSEARVSAADPVPGQQQILTPEALAFLDFLTLPAYREFVA